MEDECPNVLSYTRRRRRQSYYHIKTLAKSEDMPPLCPHPEPLLVEPEYVRRVWLHRFDRPLARQQAELAQRPRRGQLGLEQREPHADARPRTLPEREERQPEEKVKGEGHWKLLCTAWRCNNSTFSGFGIA